MGNVRWKANEIEFLKENYGVLKLEEIANAVNKTYLQLKEKLKEMVLNQLENGQIKK